MFQQTAALVFLRTLDDLAALREYLARQVGLIQTFARRGSVSLPEPEALVRQLMLRDENGWAWTKGAILRLRALLEDCAVTVADAMEDGEVQAACKALGEALGETLKAGEGATLAAGQLASLAEAIRVAQEAVATAS